MELNWDDRKFGSTAIGEKRDYHIHLDGKRFFLEVDGVTLFSGSLENCKRAAQQFENK
jgi:hypothetical protein